jgi:hypothetical protein
MHYTTSTDQRWPDTLETASKTLKRRGEEHPQLVGAMCGTLDEDRRLSEGLRAAHRPPSLHLRKPGGSPPPRNDEQTPDALPHCRSD